MSKKLNVNLLKINMNAALERIEESQQLIKQGIKDTDVQSIHYGLFEDAIATAGYLSYFGENEQKIINNLKIATHAATGPV